MAYSPSIDLEHLRAEVIDTVSALEIPKDELIVVGGAVLQVYGLKRTNDIDVVVSEERLNKVLADEWKEAHRVGVRRRGDITMSGSQLMYRRFGVGQELMGSGSEYSAAKRGNVSFMLAPDDDLYQATFEELHDEADEFDGVLVSPMHRIVAWKMAVNREKDKRDLGIILAASST